MANTRSQLRGPGRPVGGLRGQARDALLRAARALMAEKGLPRVTARQVAERADLNPALVGYYFGSKDGLLRAVVAQVAEEGLARRMEGVRAAGDASSRMRVLITNLIQFYAADPYAARLLTEQVLFAEDEVVDQFVDAFGRSHIEAFGSVLAEGQRSGEFRDLDSELAIPAISGVSLCFFLAAPIFQRVFQRETLAPEFVNRFVDEAVKLVLEGIQRPAEEES